MLKIFPHILLRIGGGHFEKLERLNVQVREDVFSASENLEKIKTDLTEHLYSSIPTLTDNALQNTLLNLRRDLFNNRNIDQQKLTASISGQISTELQNLIDKYFEEALVYQNLLKELELIYLDANKSSWEKLIELSKEEKLQKGLLLSSQSLLNRVHDYSKKGYDERRKKEFQTEQSIIKYLSRMYAKTSPFSTFTNLSFLETIKSKDFKLISNSEVIGNNKIQSHIRLNNYLYQYLRDLLIKLPEVYENLLIRPNPTISIENEERYLFLTNNQNIESFQRIDINPVMDLIKNIVSEKSSGVTYKEIVTKLAQEVEAEENELKEYVAQLLEYGFLEYNWGVSGIDPEWDEKLIDRLKPLIDVAPILERLLVSLGNLRKLAQEYENADVKERRDILKNAYKDFRGVCMNLHEAAGLPAEERRTQEEIQAENLKKYREAKEKKKQEEKESKKIEENEEQQEVEASKQENGSENKENSEEPFKHKSSTFFHFKPEQIFYEDTSKNPAVRLNEIGLEEIAKKLNVLFKALYIFEGKKYELLPMINFFKKKYGEKAKVDLLVFYEEYYREYKKPEAEYQEKKRKEALEKEKKAAESVKEKAKKSNKKIESKKQGAIKEQDVMVAEPEGKKDIIKTDPEGEKFKIPELIKHQKLSEQWSKAFEEQINIHQNDSVHISIKDIKAVNEKLEIKSIADIPKNSYGIFTQLYEEEGKIYSVLNSSFPGFGKLTSRFLHLFDEKYTKDTRKWNNSIMPENSVFAENSDASYFNANLHPPLLDCEVWLPHCHTSLPESQQIPVTDLVVELTNKDTLELKQKSTNKRVYVMDLGFQGQKGRSQSFQLLDKFTLANYIYPYMLTQGVQQKIKKQNQGTNKKPERKVIYNPRIMYEEQIILKRKSWIVPFEYLPVKEVNESDVVYLLKVKAWLRKYNIPEEVFVFISRNVEMPAPDEKLMKQRKLSAITRDDYKPQYINFNNPFLVQLFEKSINKVYNALYIEEMLPASKDLLKFENKKYVTEFLLQWYEA